MKLDVIFSSMRMPFLILTPVCVFLGASVSVANLGSVNIGLLALVLLGATLAHISVNTFNEYFDFKSGLDDITIRTAFSGGSGALPQNPEMAMTVYRLAWITFIATMLIGIFFVWQYGIGIIPVGLLGLVLILTYTLWINRYPLLCLISPGIAFGFLMVVGTQFVLQGEFLSLSWLVASVPFFLVNNLLLLNQYPDIKADSVVGRNHLPIAYGVSTGNMVYGLFVIAATGVIFLGIWTEKFPQLSWIALLPLPLALYALSGAVKYGGNLGSYPQYLAANVAVVILTPLLLGISIITG